MSECNCNMRTKLVGDGCAICNPERAADLSESTDSAAGSIADLVPTSWLDPLLTGGDAVLPPGHVYGPEDIERLLRAVKARVAKAEAQRQSSD